MFLKELRGHEEEINWAQRFALSGKYNAPQSRSAVSIKSFFVTLRFFEKIVLNPTCHQAHT
jgi:hypothetical protein